MDLQIDELTGTKDTDFLELSKIDNFDNCYSPDLLLNPAALQAISSQTNR